MPELPEAEANRRRIEAGALNRTIEGMTLHNTTHLEVPDQNERGRLTGRQFTRTHRHGKLIFAGSDGGPWIAVHLGMTGSLHTFDAPRDMPDTAHVVIVFEGDRRLVFHNPRKLGFLKVVDAPETLVADKAFGPDAMEISQEDFAARIGKTRGAVKSALMAQKKMAGVGNLWSDETLFQCGLRPDVKGTALSDRQLADLHATMRKVLGAVLDANADYAKLPGHWLIGSRKAGGQCPRCPGTIRKATIGGRSAFYCDSHQGAA